MAGTFTNINYHLIFSTKNREPFINDSQFESRLHEYLGGIVRLNHGVPCLINGMEDHIHMLIRWIPNGNLSNLMRDIKSGSSKWVHQEYPHRKTFAWQEGFGAFTVSHSQIYKVRSYIAGQKDHHRKYDFQAEFRALLKVNEIKWNEETIWL